MTPHPDVAFREYSTDRLVNRRLRAEDAASLAAYRSDPAVARYQSWDIPFSHAQARSFIESLDAAHPDSPGEWFQLAVVEAATGVHIGDVAAGVDAAIPGWRRSASPWRRQPKGGATRTRRSHGCSTTCSSTARSTARRRVELLDVLCMRLFRLRPGGSGVVAAAAPWG